MICKDYAKANNKKLKQWGIDKSIHISYTQTLTIYMETL